MNYSASTQVDLDDVDRTRVVPAAVLRNLAKRSVADEPSASRLLVEEELTTVSPSDSRAEPDEVCELDRLMFEKLFSKDCDGALEAAEAILRVRPTHKAALLAQRNCRILLEARYRSILGPVVPV